LIFGGIVLPVSAADSVDLLELSLEELSNLLVTGTRIRGADVSVPMTVLTREEIENTAFSTVEELFESLPQNFDEVTPDGRFANEGGSLLRGLNNNRVSAIDLRGLGAQSTLTLVNGTRRAGSIGGRVVDISAIPLSIVERVEVVTGGRSAVYGADAVAGVVNLVTRRNFDGTESQVYYGFAPDGGGERLQLSQMIGVDEERGGFVAAYDFARAWPFDLADAGLLSLMPNPEIGLTQLSLDARTDNRRHSLYLSGRFDVTDRIELYADGLYTDNKFEDFALRLFEGATENSFTDTVDPSEHLSLAGGARANLGGDWALELSGGWSTAENTNRSTVFVDLGFISVLSEGQADTDSALSSVSAVVDGPLPAIRGITAQAAFGVELREEEFESDMNGVPESNLDREVGSVFAELRVPLVEGAQPGLRRLELSLAGRYDDYSDFGGTFNPQAGIIWRPADELTLRAAFSTAFRAPALVELESSTDAFLELASDPALGGASVPVLFLQGEHPDLQPEEAETWSVGVDFEPEFASWAKLSLSYFQVEYDGRIEQPSINADRELVLARADRFPGLIVSTPSAAEAAAFLDADADGFIDNDTGVSFDPATDDILDVFPNLVLFDNRTSNIAVEEVRGIDFKIDGDFETEVGLLEFGVNLTHSFEHDRKVTATSPTFSLLDQVGKPVDTRVRAKAGWIRGVYGAFLYINYVDGYANPFSTPPSDVDSWTTADLTLRFSGSELTDRGFLDGLDATLGVNNLFDNGPPLFPNSLLGVLYDSTNASPFGRYLSLRLAKRW
jgi:iron complex outermembrane receptor protein